ncbi:UvrB/UvrC motif-containing protein [Neobacillus drentensis]|uniref:UvrB/UvrC motif-containing protein n=1 Tax=Neobacillus drentensis TaxID=220684 RepID=UPI002FFD9342
MNLKEKVNNLPTFPGVYLMKDANAQIIYVGKAKNLKNRVRSYFQNSKSHPQKIIKLKAALKDFDYILTDTEFEAFMLECKLIKEIKPIFNRMMKNPQSYIYIRIYKDGDYQRIEICKDADKQDSLYFGPYKSKHTVEKALLGMKDFYRVNCSSPSNKNTPCLNYSLGLCLGMCMGGAALDQYNERINKIIAIFQGLDISLLSEMEQRMQEASEKFDFEIAGKYRDTLEAIHSLLQKEKVIEFTEGNKNIAVIEHLTDMSFKLFLIKGNRIMFSEKFKSSEIESAHQVLKSNILTAFIKNENKPFMKISRDEIDFAQIIYSYLSSSNCSYFLIPDRLLDNPFTNLDNEINKLMTSYSFN